MGEMDNCSMTGCIMINMSMRDEMQMAKHSLEQFGFNDIFNVVAYSVMSIGSIYYLIYK